LVLSVPALISIAATCALFSPVPPEQVHALLLYGFPVAPWPGQHELWTRMFSASATTLQVWMSVTLRLWTVWTSTSPRLWIDVTGTPWMVSPAWMASASTQPLPSTDGVARRRGDRGRASEADVDEVFDAVPDDQGVDGFGGVHAGGGIGGQNLVTDQYFSGGFGRAVRCPPSAFPA
jgi:hypothetical protein